MIYSCTLYREINGESFEITLTGNVLAPEPGVGAMDWEAENVRVKSPLDPILKAMIAGNPTAPLSKWRDFKESLEEEFLTRFKEGL